MACAVYNNKQVFKKHGDPEALTGICKTLTWCNLPLQGEGGGGGTTGLNLKNCDTFFKSP